MTNETCTHADSGPDATGGVRDELRYHLLALGADLVGFGSVADLAGAPEIMQPRRYLPEARSMISFALHINEASCDLIERSVHDDEVPASYHSYQMFTLTIVNPQLDTLAFQGAKFLEDRGYRAYPVPANVPHVLKPTAEYPGGPGDVSHKHVAVACGLGQIGWHNLFLTPQFGARQKLTTILTNAPLDPDPVCEERLCQRCLQCARACPTAAIPDDPNAKATLELRGQRVEYAKLTGWRCRWGCSGMLKAAGGYVDIPLPDEEPSAEELLQYKAQVDPWQQRLRTLAGLIPYCGRCLCVCPAGREGEPKRGQRA